MKRMIAFAVLIVVGAFGIKVIGDATQTRPDERHRDRMTSVVVHLEGKSYRQSLDVAAQALYGKCSATVGGNLVDPGIERLSSGQYRFAMTPSLGEHGKERLFGCINDLSIERLRSNVESVEELPVEAAA
ncbi:MAG: hypothetical protein ACRDV7_01200 [Acidimicrobiia bacterium]